MSTKLDILKRTLKGLRSIYPLLNNKNAKKRIKKEAERIKSEIALLNGGQNSKKLYNQNKEATPEDAEEIFST